MAKFKDLSTGNELEVTDERRIEKLKGYPDKFELIVDYFDKKDNKNNKNKNKNKNKDVNVDNQVNEPDENADENSADDKEAENADENEK